MPRAPQVHVVWNKNKKKWFIKKSGKIIRSSFGYSPKTDAVYHAILSAMEFRAELVIHKQDGEIQRKHSYGNDPRSTKG